MKESSFDGRAFSLGAWNLELVWNLEFPKARPRRPEKIPALDHHLRYLRYLLLKNPFRPL